MLQYLGVFILYSEHFMIYLGEYQKEENEKAEPKKEKQKDCAKIKFVNFLLNLFGIA